MIKGFTGTTLLDFPGRIAALIFMGGCNFRCPFCHNPGLVKVSDLDRIPTIPPEEILARLSQRKGFIDGVVISGGEPLIYRDLLNLIEKISRLGLATKIDTNGYFPGHLQGLLDSGLVEYAAMDIKTSPAKYSLAAGTEIDYSRIQASVNIIKESAVNYEFRTTMVPGIVEKDDILLISESVKGAQTYVLQQFNPHHVLNPVYEKVKPYPAAVLENYAHLAENFVKKVIIRNVDPKINQAS